MAQVRDTLAALAPPLDGRAHKGQAGRVGVLGGSVDYSGAPFYVRKTRRGAVPRVWPQAPRANPRPFPRPAGPPSPLGAPPPRAMHAASLSLSRAACRGPAAHCLSRGPPRHIMAMALGQAGMSALRVGAELL